MHSWSQRNISVEVIEITSAHCVLRADFNKLFLVTPKPTDILRVLSAAWLNLKSGLHFLKLPLSSAQAKKLSEKAKFSTEFATIARACWFYMRPVSGYEYNSKHPRQSRSKDSFGGYRLHRGGNIVYGLTEGHKLNEQNTLSKKYIESTQQYSGKYRDRRYDVIVVFKEADFADFLQVGMMWKQFSHGYLCPHCNALESGHKVKEQRKYKTLHSTQYSESGIYECIVSFECVLCKTRWDHDRSHYDSETSFP